MTETPAPYHVYSRESHLQAHIVKRLRDAGWQVIVTSQDRRTRKQLRHIPDLIAFRDNTTLLIECKRVGGRLSDGQREFEDEVLCHTGKNLIYVEAYYLADVAEWIAE